MAPLAHGLGLDLNVPHAHSLVFIMGSGDLWENASRGKGVGFGNSAFQAVYAFACKAATRPGTNLLTQNIFLLPLTTTTSPALSRFATSPGFSVAGSSCQPRPLPARHTS